jgi:hypothetical protein
VSLRKYKIPEFVVRDSYQRFLVRDSGPGMHSENSCESNDGRDLEVDGEIEKSVKAISLVLTSIPRITIKDLAHGITVRGIIDHLSVSIGNGFRGIDTKAVNSISFDLSLVS